MQTEYKGYAINFNENSEEWSCYSISFSHKSLSKVKDKINRLHIDLRKASAIRALSCKTFYSSDLPRFFDATILEYCEPIRRKETSFERTPTGPICDHVVYASFTDRDDSQPSRKKVNLSDMYQDTPENHKIMAELVSLTKQINQMKKILHETAKRMATIDAALLDPLIEASGHVFSEGETSNKRVQNS